MALLSVVTMAQGQAHEIFTCPSRGSFRDPDSCDRYFTCVEEVSGLRAYPVDCPSGLLFNPAIEQCDWPNNDGGCVQDIGDGPPQVAP